MLTDVAALLAEWARSHSLVNRVFIFGSRARGDHRPDSDLDVAVELDPEMLGGDDSAGGLSTWMEESDAWKEELQHRLPFLVDLEQLSGDHTPIIQQAVTEDGRLVYEKNEQRS